MNNNTTTTNTTTTTETLVGPVDLELAGYIDAVASEGERFAATATAGDFDAPIAACPGWDLRELVKHVGLVHLWAAANIAYPSERWLSVDTMSDLETYWPEHTRGWPDDDGLVDWYRSTLTNLVDVLVSTPSDHECLTFLPGTTPLTMWARRQASEIAVHRYDAATAAGVAAPFEPAFALDMLDELINGFGTRMRVQEPGVETTIHVAPDDVADDFVLSIGPERVRTDRRDGPADLRIRGSVADLYVLMWNRPAGATIRLDGDASALDTWSRTCRIEWL